MSSTFLFRDFEPQDTVYCQFIRRTTFIREFINGSPELELWASAEDVSPQQFGQLLKTLRVLVAEYDDYVCGFCALRLHQAGIVEVAYLYIKSDMRELALGSALLRYAEMAVAAELDQVEVFTATVPEQNEEWWRAEGYSVTAATPNGTLRNGPPAIRVRKHSRSRSEAQVIAGGSAVCR